MTYLLLFVPTASQIIALLLSVRSYVPTWKHRFPKSRCRARLCIVAVLSQQEVVTPVLSEYYCLTWIKSRPTIHSGTNLSLLR